MRYSERKCPICGNRFSVDENVSRERTFCTLACYMKSEKQAFVR